MMEAAEPQPLGLPFTVTTCTLSVISGTVKHEMELQYVKNSQAFLEAADKVEFGGREETVQRI